MLKLFNQRCLALQPLKTRLISGFLPRSGFAAHFSTAAAGKPYLNPQEAICVVEEKFGISWKQTYFPLSPEFCMEPKYPDDVNQLVPSSDISLSSLFGTRGYLVRNNGDRVDLKADTFKGKYVFVCCFHVPPALNCWRATKLCHELLYCTRDDIEVVMAASVVDGDDGKQVFDHFFSSFPKPCLAVPFEDSKRRAHVCKLVADYTCSELNRHIPCLCLDTEGMVLPLCKCSSNCDLTVDILNAIKARDEQVVKKSISLEELLLINSSSPDAVYKLNPEGGPREEVRILELKDKLVGLYVPGRSCDLFPTLVDIYEQCMKRQMDFEVVVANREKVDDRLLLQKHDICRQWWWLPFNKSVNARLDKLIKAYSRHLITSDKLCVVGPAGGFIDMYVPGKVMKMYGVDGYPFTRETVIQKEVAKMREITLESVLLGGDIFRGTDGDDVTSAEKLLGRKISVYFGCPYYVWDHERLLSSYREMKAKDPGFEVVFVYLKNDRDSVELLNKSIYSMHKSIYSMPWYVCSFDLDRLESVREKLGMYILRLKSLNERLGMSILRREYRDFGLGIVGFGEDGRVRSCRPADVATFTLDDTLYEDVSKRRSDLPCNLEDL